MWDDVPIQMANFVRIVDFGPFWERLILWYQFAGFGPWWSILFETEKNDFEMCKNEFFGNSLYM